METIAHWLLNFNSINACEIVIKMMFACLEFLENKPGCSLDNLIMSIEVLSWESKYYMLKLYLVILSVMLV